MLISVFLCALVLIGAVWVVTLRNLFRAALSLGIVLLGVAGLFLVLEAEFLAFVQVLIYVGAILTLVIFAIMLTANLQRESTPASRQPVFAALVAGGLFLLLVGATTALVQPLSSEPIAVTALGTALVRTLVLPFEVISVIFVAAVIGAITVASPPRRPTSSP